MKVLVIIVTFNGIRWIRKCLSSVKEYDTFVIDNGSTDGTQQLIQSEFPNVIFRQNGKNLGFGMANNIGMKYAITNGYDYVYLMNQDAWVLPDTINTLISTIQNHPDYGILSPMQMQDGLDHFDTTFLGNTCSWKSTSTFLEDLYHGKRADVYEVSFVMAAHWLVSAECIRKVGLFSPTFLQYGEDYNYLNRLLFHGMKVGIVPEAVAVHDRGERKVSKKMEQYHLYINAIRDLSAIYKTPNPLRQIMWSTLKGIILYSVADTVKYFFWIMRDYQKIKRNQEESRNKGAFLSN